MLTKTSGEIITSEGKEKKLNIDFEPFKPINTSLYLYVPTSPQVSFLWQQPSLSYRLLELWLKKRRCDNKFHTEALSELLESDQRYGFVM